MKAVIEKIRREPALLVGFVSAAISLAAAFGFDLTAEQTGAIMAAVTAGLAFVVRAQVTPNVSVAAAEEHDVAGAQLVAGDAAALPNETPVDVVPAESVYGQRDEAGYGAIEILVAIACVVVIVCGLFYLFA